VKLELEEARLGRRSRAKRSAATADEAA
jgi:hypothetical protein